MVEVRTWAAGIIVVWLVGASLQQHPPSYLQQHPPPPWRWRQLRLLANADSDGLDSQGRDSVMRLWSEQGESKVLYYFESSSREKCEPYDGSQYTNNWGRLLHLKFSFPCSRVLIWLGKCCVDAFQKMVSFPSSQFFLTKKESVISHWHKSPK